MTQTLTAEQRRAVAESPNEPIRLTDPETMKVYVLISETYLCGCRAHWKISNRVRHTRQLIERLRQVGVTRKWTITTVTKRSNNEH